jgi:3-oxoacyl-[acyl-carrier protein] reductase
MKRVILITGGSRGLGACLVNRLSGNSRLMDVNGEETAVIFTYVNSSENALKLASGSENIQGIKCDQRDENQVKRCHETIFEKYGRLDVLINNACAAFMPCDLLSSGWDKFQELLDTNLKGAYCHMREAAEIMKKQGSGRIINILSAYVLNTPPEKIAFYITAKYALLGLTRSSAVELVKYGITVNAISPGLMETDLSGYLPRKYLEVYASRHPMKRMTQPSDVADAAAYLISDGAAFLNGVNIPVNGGESF